MTTSVHYVNYPSILTEVILMTETNDAAEELLDAWLSLTSTLWNTRIVHSMTFNEAHVMGILLRMSTSEHPLTATDLIRRTNLLKSQMNKVLSTLEAKGFILRLRAASDRRMAHILLTEEGKTAYLAEHARVESILSRLVNHLGQERALSIAHDLQDVISALDAILPTP